MLPNRVKMIILEGSFAFTVHFIQLGIESKKSILDETIRSASSLRMRLIYLS